MAVIPNIDGQSRQASKSWVEIDTKNLTDIDLMFRQLPKQVSQDSVWNKFWRRVSKPLVKAARDNAKQLKGSGQLAKSIGYFRTKASKRYHGGYVGPRVKGSFATKQTESSTGKKLKGKKQYTKSGFYGAWVEYGSEVMFGGKGRGEDQPFMKKAWDSDHKMVLVDGMKDAQVIFERALKIHERRLKKYGLGY
tara:strand:- start:47 stop:625 length:579 start_codon:yes stop_codon:yes gene_type:complete